MIGVLDADFFSLLYNPDAEPPFAPGTDEPVTQVPERMALFLEDIAKAHGRLVIPAPAMAEVLVIAGNGGDDLISFIDGNSFIRVEPFDAKAAVEAAAMTRRALHDGGFKGGSTKSRACVKVDRQVVAIAKSIGAVKVFSNDKDVAAIAAACGLEVVHVADLRVPEKPPLLAIAESADAEPTTAETEMPPAGELRADEAGPGSAESQARAFSGEESDASPEAPPATASST